MSQAIPSSGCRWAIYLRISRTDDRLGVERQRDDCLAQLATMGVAEADVELFDENNTSATKGLDARPEYRRLLGEINAGRIGGVMVFLQDRAWRDTDELSAFLKLGCRFATSSTGEADLDDPDTYANVKIAAVQAEREIKLVSRRTSKASAQRAKAGKAHGRAPFGWRREVAISRGRVVDSWDEIDEAEAGLIRYVAKELLAGKSLRSLTLEANLGSVKPRPYTYVKGARAGLTVEALWTSGKLRDLLLRGSNAGLRRHKGEILEGVTAEWPAILDVQTYQRLVLMFKDPSRRTNEAGSAPRYLLSGTIATCSVCPDGGRINVVTGGNQSGRRSTYTCVGKAGSKGCFQRHWIEDVDAYVGELVEARLADPAFSGAAPEAQSEIDELYRRIDELRAEQDEAGKLKAARKITLPQLVEINEAIEAELEALDAKISALRPATLSDVELPDGWAGADIRTKRAVVRRLFASIVFVPSTIDGRRRTAETIDEEILVQYR
jgi:DNA invertase Pin-like site-specific DNA recombinase